jgi:hypothetical protein
VSEIVNEGSGKIVHEVTPDGAVFFGATLTRATPTSRRSTPPQSRWSGAGPVMRGS